MNSYTYTGAKLFISKEILIMNNQLPFKRSEEDEQK